MNAQEMLEQAIAGYQGKNRQKKGGFYLHSCGLRMATVMKLARDRSWYVTRDAEGDYKVDIEKVREGVLSGDILKVRNFGIGLLREVCEWLEGQPE